MSTSKKNFALILPQSRRILKWPLFSDRGELWQNLWNPQNGWIFKLNVVCCIFILKTLCIVDRMPPKWVQLSELLKYRFYLFHFRFGFFFGWFQPRRGSWGGDSNFRVLANPVECEALTRLEGFQRFRAKDQALALPFGGIYVWSVHVYLRCVWRIPKPRKIVTHMWIIIHELTIAHFVILFPHKSNIFCHENGEKKQDHFFYVRN